MAVLARFLQGIQHMQRRVFIPPFLLMSLFLGFTPAVYSEEPIKLGSIREVPALASNTFRYYEITPGRYLLQYEDEALEVQYEKKLNATHPLPYSIQYLSSQEFKKRLDKLGYFSHVDIKDFQLDTDFEENFLAANFDAAKSNPDGKSNLRMLDPEDAMKMRGSYYVGRGKPLDTKLKKVLIPTTEIAAMQALWFAALSPMAAGLRYSPYIVTWLGGRWEQMDGFRTMAAGVVGLGIVSLSMQYKVLMTGKKIEMPFKRRQGRWALATLMVGIGLTYTAGSATYLTCVNILRALAH